MPFVLEIAPLAVDRSDLFGLPGGTRLALAFLAAWALGPVCVVPMAMLWSAHDVRRLACDRGGGPRTGV